MVRELNLETFLYLQKYMHNLLNTYLRLYGLYSIDDLSTAGVM